MQENLRDYRKTLRTIEPYYGVIPKDIKITTEEDQIKTIKKLFSLGYRLRHGNFWKDTRTA